MDIFLSTKNHCVVPPDDIRAYQAKHGLPSNAAKDVFQDSRGYIWIVGQEGLIRFDGARFVRFEKSKYPSLREDFIWDIEEGWMGRLWLDERVTLKSRHLWVVFAESSQLHIIAEGGLP